ncbi:MAG: hypothetical protein ABI641_07005 [Caldimonas sp.]
MRPALWLAPCAALAVLVSACGEKVQTVPMAGARKVDEKSWVSNNNPYVAPGWTPGNEASWDAQLRNRAHAQNDFEPRK